MIASPFAFNLSLVAINMSRNTILIAINLSQKISCLRAGGFMIASRNNYARGWTEDGQAKGNPMSALDRVGKASANQSAIFILKDIATLIAPCANRAFSFSGVKKKRKVIFC